MVVVVVVGEGWGAPVSFGPLIMLAPGSAQPALLTHGLFMHSEFES